MQKNYLLKFAKYYIMNIKVWLNLKKRKKMRIKVKLNQRKKMKKKKMSMKDAIAK